MGGIILLASMIIWLLGYFPRNESLLSSYDKQSEKVIEDYEMQLLENSDKPELIQMLSQKKDLRISEIQKKRESRRQELSFIGRAGRFIEPIMRPLGFDWKMSISLIAGGAAKEIVVSTMGVLYATGESENNTRLISKIREQSYTDGPRSGEKVFTPLVAFSFMIFVLIYFPCVAVLAAVKKESGKWKWALFVAVYTTGLAWIMSFLVYQLGSLL
jgi:ferrous iron transport protein B